MNQYPLWKYLLILFVIAIGALYAVPNLYPNEPAVQVSPSLRGAKLDPALADRVKSILDDKAIAYRRIETDTGKLVVRFDDTELQLKAKDIVKEELGRNFAVALNLVPTTPEWLRSLNALPMYLGLDLRGGVYFLMEVDMAAAERLGEERYVSDIRSACVRKRYVT